MRQTNTILDKIIRGILLDLESRKQKKSLMKIIKEVESYQRSHIEFSLALKNKNHDNLPSLIAEIKKSSPSTGTIRNKFDLEEITKVYQESQLVKAISVITEENYFHGNGSYVKRVRESSTKPILRKDFIVDEYQVFESYLLQADAILLIAKCLTEKELKNLLKLAYSLGLEVLVEVHDLKELEMVLDSDAKIIGVNTRNLNDFSIDLSLLETLIPKIPQEIIKVAESGIQDYSSLSIARDAGSDAVLVGTLFMGSHDMNAEINKLFNY